jgi:hypothetical protein
VPSPVSRIERKRGGALLDVAPGDMKRRFGAVARPLEHKDGVRRARDAMRAAHGAHKVLRAGLTVVVEYEHRHRVPVGNRLERTHCRIVGGVGVAVFPADRPAHLCEHVDDDEPRAGMLG